MKTISISKWVAVGGLITFLGVFTASAQVLLPIGDLKPGESIVITYDVELTNQFSALTSSVTNQGTLLADNISSVSSDHPKTPFIGDPTITLVYVPPTAITLEATEITLTTANLHALLGPNGQDTTSYFEYGVTTNYGDTAFAHSLSPITYGAILIDGVANLYPSTLYHYRLYASNSSGVAYGQDKTFTTVALPPAVLTGLTRQADGTVQFVFTNTPSQPFTILASTNISLPLSNWTVIGPAIEGPLGQFNFSDNTATNVLRFYRARWN